MSPCEKSHPGPKPLLLPREQWKTWPDRIRHFTPAWFAVVMGTGAVSALLNDFPYGQENNNLRIAGCVWFILNIAIFVFACVCSLLRYVMYPEIFWLMLSHTSQSLYIGCFPMGAATLINSALALNQNWGFGGKGFLYFLWGCWWLDSAFSYLVAFGMLYTMTVRHEHSLSNMAAVWLLPVVPLVVASSTGGLLSEALRPHAHTLALISTAFSFVMVAMGLAFALMMITIYLLRLLVHSVPDPGLILSAFIVLGPLGQGGFSLLINGTSISELLPLHVGADFPQSALTGQMIFAVCFCGAYALWAIGIAWVVVAVCSIYHVVAVRRTKISFNMGYWGMIFPNGVFALLIVELSRVLQSPFFKVLGSLWSALTFLLWGYIFVRSIPPFIDGSLFMAPCLPDGRTRQQLLPTSQTHSHSSQVHASPDIVPHHSPLRGEKLCVSDPSAKSSAREYP
ncbi:voltage-dependent anion channel-domain-containing protein [Rhodofomes roseus]|uniref:Voltage-dependent anion channel-domain-containing protein n=1 Tax=Rhodofomes roseus TaxID=34475 RepID=A0ABQ8KMI2_9APHY|nr:voltage-dependent anion channel-domain-containing protein [Rhodofomes roseus]KAH9839411.1 voltage-dependent anion channel-domain-containing protein [Rhodofomes roseus]